ncbi:hypothetical protein [Streptomyces javensis]|uniref:Uncharacterized protein n=1 Tax=Streptomyces javensis TaxID=114698 RepID=A0ABN1X6H8_9ACTN
MADTCPACNGARVTEHTEHTVETDENGQQKPVTRTWTGPCGTCNGTGTTG